MGDLDRTHPNHASSRGYTLFELNLSLAILTVAILTSIYMVRNSATFVRASGNLTLASQLVESVMDEAHVSNIYDLTGVSEPRYFNFYGAEIGDRRDGAKYVAQTIGTIRGSYLELSVTVAWNRDGSMAPESIIGEQEFGVKRVSMVGRVIAK